MRRFRIPRATGNSGDLITAVQLNLQLPRPGSSSERRIVEQAGSTMLHTLVPSPHGLGIDPP